MNLKNARVTIETLERDLYSLRGLAAQLDASKDQITLELANKDALCQQLDKVRTDEGRCFFADLVDSRFSHACILCLYKEFSAGLTRNI